MARATADSSTGGAGVRAWRALRGAAPHLGVLLLFALILLPMLLIKPYFHHHGEDTIVVADIVFGGNPWRVMEVAVFNWFGLNLFHERWQGIAALSALLNLGVGFLCYLLWLELAHLLGERARAATGGAAPGLLAGYASMVLSARYITDITGVSYRLAALFALLTLVSALRCQRTGRWGWWLAAMGSYLLACLSHSFTWPLGLLVLLLELTRRRRDPGDGAPGLLPLRYLLMAAVPVGVLLWSGAYTFLLQFLEGDSPGPHNAVGGPFAFMLGRYIYMVVTALVIHPVFADLPRAAGALEWAGDALLVLVMLAGLARLWRGRGLDILGLVTLFVLVWFIFTVLPLLVSAVEWQAGVYRFTYPMLGATLTAAYLAARLLSLAARLLPRAWRGPRLVTGAALCLIAAHLPGSPTAAGLARFARSGRTGLHDPCPGQAACASIRVLSGGAVEGMGRDPALSCADLSMADLSGADLGAPDLRRANLSGGRYIDTRMVGARLQESCGYYADMRGLKLGPADLRGARLIGCFMNRADLAGADLRGASLRSGHLQEATLTGANLGKADLVRVALAGADLRGANLAGANLTGSDLTQADLRGADLRGANLVHTHMIDTRLDGANMAGALLCEDGANLVVQNETVRGAVRTVKCSSEPQEEFLRPPWY